MERASCVWATPTLGGLVGCAEARTWRAWPIIQLVIQHCRRSSPLTYVNRGWVTTSGRSTAIFFCGLDRDRSTLKKKTSSDPSVSRREHSYNGKDTQVLTGGVHPALWEKKKLFPAGVGLGLGSITPVLPLSRKEKFISIRVAFCPPSAFQFHQAFKKEGPLFLSPVRTVHFVSPSFQTRVFTRKRSPRARLACLFWYK